MNQQIVLVTGGAGFIGSELTRQIVDGGSSVVVLDNLSNGKLANLEGIPSAQMRLVVGDIRDNSLLASLLKGVSVVYHLACLGVRHSIHSPMENHDVNANGTLKLLMESRRAGVKRFVYVSSSEVYGTARWTPMSEEHPTFPTTVYGASKLAGECYARAFHRTYAMPTVIVRPFNCYGPRSHHEGDSGEVVPKFLLRCLAGRPMIVFGDGKQTRDFTYVSDIARGILQAGHSDAAVGRTINLGSGREISIADLAREVARVTGRSDAAVVYDSPRPGDVQRLCADITLARQILQFEPRYCLREGLTRLYSWYLSLEQSPARLLEEEIVHNWAMEGTKPHG